MAAKDMYFNCMPASGMQHEGKIQLLSRLEHRCLKLYYSCVETCHSSPLSLVPLMFILLTDTDKANQHQRRRERQAEIRSQPQWTLPQGQGLINNIHISKLHWIKSNMPCFKKTKQKKKHRIWV